MFRNNPWELFRPFQSVPYTRKFLQNIYEQSRLDQITSKSYQNSYPFVYYLEHGKKHFQLAGKAPRELKPMLLFYGMTQLIKACLLTVDPDYPKTTAVLAHGVSTRKRKKRGYSFLEDEVKIQKNGLLAHFSAQLFHVKQIEGEKFRMNDLLRRIPDLNELFLTLCGTAPFCLVKNEEGQVRKVPESVLDNLHMTTSRYKKFIEQYAKIKFGSIEHTKEAILFRPASNLKPFQSHPFHFSLDHQYYLPVVRAHYEYFPETIVHFLLLYNLSMISRYETEWWSELFHHSGTNDLPFIDAFLEVSVQKIPLMLACFLESLA